MEKWKKKTIELVANLAFFSKPNPAVIPYAPAKTEIARYEHHYFHRTSPERHGISSSRIFNMLTALENEPRANIHNLLVIKDGDIITECSAPGYSTGIRHLAHSMTKSLVGMAIGFLFDEGNINLDSKIASFFPEYEPKDKKFKEISVRHALTMSTGVSFNEAGSITETEWTRAYFESKVSFTPGTLFAYNSMNTYILGRIVAKISGMSLTEFLTPRLFAPLGISNVFWEIGPEGIEKGGWGIYLSCESWAKIALMMLNNGRFEGERILSEEWVKESTSKKIDVPESTGGFNYGYQIWTGRDNEEFLFNGMLGQNVWISPKNNIIAVINSENNELFQKSPALEILQKHLSEIQANDELDCGARFAALKHKERSFFVERMWAKPKPALKGLSYRLGLRSRSPFDTEWSRILGKYTLAKNNHGILPFFIRAMQNNYSMGIEELVLEREGEHLVLCTVEGGATYSIKVGFYDYESSIVDFQGEKYIVRAICEHTLDDDGKPLYKINIIFPEMPNSRRIALSFGSEGQLIIKLSEIPNEKIAEPFVEGLYTTNPKLSFAIGLLERRLGDKFIARRLQSLFSPTITGARDGAKNFDSIIDEENEKNEKKINETAAATSMLLRLSDSLDDD